MLDVTTQKKKEQKKKKNSNGFTKNSNNKLLEKQEKETQNHKISSSSVNFRLKSSYLPFKSQLLFKSSTLFFFLCSYINAAQVTFIPTNIPKSKQSDLDKLKAWQTLQKHKNNAILQSSKKNQSAAVLYSASSSTSSNLRNFRNAMSNIRSGRLQGNKLTIDPSILDLDKIFNLMESGELSDFGGDLTYDGALRLAGSSKLPYMGRVEVYRRAQNGHPAGWGHICGNGWNQNDAQVVCRQLGYTDGNVLAIRRSKIFGSDKRYPILANRLRCKGDEQQITDCPGYWLHENVQQS